MKTDTGIRHLPDIVEGLQIGTYTWRPGPDGVVWSRELAHMYRVERTPQTEAEFGELVHPDDRVRVQAETSAYLGSDAASYSHTFRILRADGVVRVVLDRGTIERDKTGVVICIRGANIDITDEVGLCPQIGVQLRESERRYQALFNAIDTGFCIVEVRLDAPDGRVDYRVIEANPAFYAKTGFPAVILGRWLRQAAPGLEEHWFETYGNVARTRTPVRFENRSDLLQRWFDVYAFPIDDPDAHHVAILFSDVSEPKAREEQTRLMVEELNHRSKNMLGVIQAIARNVAKPGADNFLDRFTDRVRALSASNDLLVANRWSAVMLADLLYSQLAPFSDDYRDRVHAEGLPVALNPMATKALGMTFFELATNAVKYGALSTAPGRISVTWRVETDDLPVPQFVLVWKESLGPPVTRPLHRGFGWKVTTAMIEGSTQGAVQVDHAPDGLVWTLVCPAPGVFG